MSNLRAKKPEEVKQGKAKGLIYARSGVGKTWFSLSFPKPYYIDTEGGADGVEYQKRLKAADGAYMGPEEGALDLKTIVDEIKALATEKHDYHTLVIDSITKVYQTCISNEAERLGDKDAFGASKKPAINLMRRLVNWCMKLDMNVWFVAHETTEWGIDPRTGQRSEIGKMPDTWEKLIYELDLGITAVRIGSQYPATAIVKKSRLSGFPEGDSFPLEYSSFAERYGKDCIESDVVQLSLASEEQIKEIERLVDVLKVPAEESEKVLTKAGADEWKDLNKDQAEKTLVWLNNKIKGIK